MLAIDPVHETDEARTELTNPEPSRLERRKAQTRAALLEAAQSFIAVGESNVPILELTTAADVGMGSFYNHFQTKDELFRAAVEEALDRYGAVLDHLTEDLDDPAQIFTQGFRLTGRLHRLNPTLSKVLLSSALTVVTSDKGLAPRARRDIEAAARAGRFHGQDAELSMAIVTGAAMCLVQLLHDNPERDDAVATDQVVVDILRMFGIPYDEADEICRRPLLSIDEL